MSSSVWIGVDLGTSGCRAIAIDQHNKLIAQIAKSHPIPCRNASTHTQDPWQQWQQVAEVLSTLCQQLTQYQIKAIAVDATSGSVMLCDKSGSPISPMLMYDDVQAKQQAEKIAQIAPLNSAAQSVSSGLAKGIFLQQSSACKKGYLMHQADWINFKLGAKPGVTDYNNALKTGYDPIHLAWPDWLQGLIDTEMLPEVVAPGTVIGQLSPELTQQWKLPEAPSLITGTTDSVAAFVATGANQVGDGVTSLGSTLVLKLISDQPVCKPSLGIYSHRLGKLWLSGGASNSGGQVLQHFFNPAELNALSNKIDLSYKAPDYYPLLTPGERFPINDPKLKPHITPRPDQDWLFLYGLLDGIARIEMLGYQALQQCGAAKLTSIRSVGGGAQNQVWQTIRQRHLEEVPFIATPHTEAAYGTALLARDRLQQY